jgi:hypothetical protein
MIDILFFFLVDSPMKTVESMEESVRSNRRQAHKPDRIIGCSILSEV